MGKTAVEYMHLVVCGKHPHERGEDAFRLSVNKVAEETPPRAWGRRVAKDIFGDVIGNTPTSVGKTAASHAVRAPHEKHPHERGED